MLSPSATTEQQKASCEKRNVTLWVTMSCFSNSDAKSFELLESDLHLGNSFHTRKKKQLARLIPHLSRNLEFETFQTTKYRPIQSFILDHC